MGDQYFSDKSFKEFARILAKIIKDDIKKKFEEHRFGCGMIDGTTDKAQLSQEAGLHRIFNMKTYVPEEIVLGLSQLQSENAEGVCQSLNCKAMYLG